MTLKEIDVKTFEDYTKKSPYRTFMQTEEVGKLRKLNGWTAYYLLFLAAPGNLNVFSYKCFWVSFSR